MAARASIPRRLGTTTRFRQALTLLLWYGSWLVLALVFLTPIVWSLVSSLKDSSTVMRFPPTLFPEEPRWDNYLTIFEKHPFATWIWNTTQITLLATFGTIVSALLVAYSFARFRYPGREAFFFMTVSTLILPTEVTIVPTYLLHRQLGWLDTYLPLIVPFWLGGSAFYIFLLRQFLLTLPRDLDEAARIDGSSSLQTLVFVLAPLCKPAILTVTVISFIQHWDEFFLPLIYLNTPALFPISVGLRFFQNTLQGEGPSLYHLMMAGATVATVPPIVLFAAAQRYFVQGVVMSGIKA